MHKRWFDAPRTRLMLCACSLLLFCSCSSSSPSADTGEVEVPEEIAIESVEEDHEGQVLRHAVFFSFKENGK